MTVKINLHNKDKLTVIISIVNVALSSKLPLIYDYIQLRESKRANYPS